MKALNFFLILIMAFATTLNAQLVNQEDSNGDKQGKWVKYFDNGKVKYEGQFHLGKPVGKFTYYYKKGGTKAVSEFSDNGSTADNITYHENGKKMAEGRFVNQKKEGVWKYYLNESSNPEVSSETYKNGILFGESITYYPDSGNPTEIVFYINGKKDGKLLKYFPDGTLMTESYYKDGLPDGTFVHYYMNGKVQIEGSYIDGVQTGEWKYYNEDGNEVDAEEFKKQDEVKNIE